MMRSGKTRCSAGMPMRTAGQSHDKQGEKGYDHSGVAKVSTGQYGEYSPVEE